MQTGNEKLDFKKMKQYQKRLKTLANTQTVQKCFYPLYENPIRYFLEVFRMAWFLHKIIPKDKTLVFLCIGASNYMGDVFGPYIGGLLKENMNRKILVYGDLKDCVHGGNLLKYIELLYKKHKDDFVIAIDAGTSSAYRKGSVVVYQRGICPGRSYYSGTAKIGDISILGFTERNYEELLKLKGTDSYLYDMIYFTTRSIIKVLEWFGTCTWDVPVLMEEQKIVKERKIRK